MLHRDEKMIQRAELAVNMARKEYYPDFTLERRLLQHGRHVPMYMFRADFKIPLYYFRKQRAAVTEQSQNWRSRARPTRPPIREYTSAFRTTT